MSSDRAIHLPLVGCAFPTSFSPRRTRRVPQLEHTARKLEQAGHFIPVIFVTSRARRITSKKKGPTYDSREVSTMSTAWTSRYAQRTKGLKSSAIRELLKFIQRPEVI